jgi:hypothetical protein
VIVALTVLGFTPALAGKAEALDVEFLDYLAACEGKDDNWTVVADDKKKKKAAEKVPEKAPAPQAPPARDAAQPPEARS